MPTFAVSFTATINVSMLVNAPDKESAMSADIDLNEAIYTDSHDGLGCDLSSMRLSFDADSIDYASFDAEAVDPVADTRVAHVVADEE